MKKFLYFQPEYVDKFKCDGSKCDAICCKGWRISIDAESYEQYSHIEPPEVAAEITSHMKFDSENKVYFMTLDAKGFCPMLTENNLCRLQAEYGEKFLSKTCATYPRITYELGDLFERSLFLTCPVAAEMILFEQEPMKFQFVEVSEDVHSNGGKIIISSLVSNKFFAEEAFELQGAMISLLQERRLTINQRLIVLGFFVDKLEEIFSVEVSSEAEAIDLIRNIKRLIASYNPQVFLREGVPSVIQKVSFDAEKFIALMLLIFEPIYVDAYKTLGATRKYFDAVIEILQIAPVDNHRASVEEVAANYTALADVRKIFEERYSTVLENFLVNELFSNLVPWKLGVSWRLGGSITKNFIVFVAMYKVFELIVFAATLRGFTTKSDLLSMISWFMRDINHDYRLQKKILELLEGNDDFLDMLEMLL